MTAKGVRLIDSAESGMHGGRRLCPIRIAENALV
jgi:hypothetical protein